MCKTDVKTVILSNYDKKGEFTVEVTKYLDVPKIMSAIVIFVVLC